MMLDEIRRELKTQDNRITADPIFCVEQKRKDWGYESSYSDEFDWMNMDGDHEIADDEKWEQLNDYEEQGIETGPWEKVYFKERWEFVTACFTEKAAQEYIDRQSHNLGPTRIYVHSAYHNTEWKNIRLALMNNELKEMKKIVEGDIVYPFCEEGDFDLVGWNRRVDMTLEPNNIANQHDIAIKRLKQAKRIINRLCEVIPNIVAIEGKCILKDQLIQQALEGIFNNEET